MSIFSLNGNDWLLTGYWKHFWTWSKPEPGESDPRAAIPTIPAKVPGAVQLDLMASGLLSDPNIGLNSLDGEWVNNREWVYCKRFTLPEGYAGKRFHLVCLGLDYSGFIRLNGEVIHSFSGMFLPLSIDITDFIQIGGNENILEILFEQSPEVDGQIGYSSRIRTLKSRFNYIWDWCTRIVPVGIWDDIYIHITGPARFINIFPDVRLSEDNRSGEILLQLELEASTWVSAEVEVELESPEGKRMAWRWPVELAPGINLIARRLEVEEVFPWWPNGYGLQNLYSVTTRLILSDGIVSDENCRRIGFRRVECELNEGAPPGARPYTLVINGRKVFLQGVNWVPVTPFYGAEHIREYDGLLTHFQKMNCNILRVWGGAILEKELFYNLCDEKGILVWQEFPQSSSGIDNTPPDDKEFLENLKAVATSMIKRRRHHPSLVIWCGGNELFFEPQNPDVKHQVPVDERHPNIGMLYDLVKELDPGRIWLPCSPSGPVGTAPDMDYFGKGLCHDVHGWWNYLGPEYHYLYYNADDSLFRSEVGTPATNSLETLKKLAGLCAIWPPNEENHLWVHHGSWWIQWDEMQRIFGEWREEELERYIWCSQYLQSESLRYILESNRRRQWRCSGSIIWMGNEPFANTANTAIVEVWGRLKPASAFVRRAYTPHHVSLRYEKISYNLGENFCGQVFVHNGEADAIWARVYCQVFDLRGVEITTTYYKDVEVPGESTINLGHMEFTIPEVVYGLFLVRLVLDDGVGIHINNYLFGLGGDFPLWGLKGLENTSLSASIVEATRDRGIIEIENRGGVAAILPVLRSPEDLFYIYPDDEAQILLPGEDQKISFSLKPRTNTGFKIPIKLRIESLNAPYVELDYMPKL